MKNYKISFYLIKTKSTLIIRFALFGKQRHCISSANSEMKIKLKNMIWYEEQSFPFSHKTFFIYTDYERQEKRTEKT